MGEKVLELKTVREVIYTCTNMYHQGWCERTGGDISAIIDPEEFGTLLPNKPLRLGELNFDASPLIGRYLVVTASGNYFRNVQYEPLENIGIIKIEDATHYGVYWGLENGGVPTSELATHCLTHSVRLMVNPNHRILIHCHPTHTIAYTYVMPEDEGRLTRILWKMSAECILTFPEGVGYLPWMVNGGKEIGEATAAKAADYRAIIWGQHGIFSAGNNVDEAFGLIEAIEKASTIYMLTKDRLLNPISDENLKKLADSMGVIYNQKVFDTQKS